MTIEEIKELIQVVLDSGVAELEVQRGDNRVRIRRATAASQEVVLPPASAAAVTNHAAPSPKSPAEAAIGDKDIAVKSPIVGTYYDAPEPGAPPFVKIGDRVEPHQTLCIIESMKLMNEIESEVSGTVVAKLLASGRPVEYGEPLFTIRPL
jgi:acetyl-CoA carboxylase biotin carboxyl carrier protein